MVPLLIFSFGNFSIISFIPNILILGVIPFTMTLGFILGFLGFFSYHFSIILSWLINFFLVYEIFIIKLFGQFNGPEIKFLNFWIGIIYYLILIIFIFYNKIPKKIR